MAGSAIFEIKFLLLTYHTAFDTTNFHLKIPVVIEALEKIARSLNEFPGWDEKKAELGIAQGFGASLVFLLSSDFFIPLLFLGKKKANASDTGSRSCRRVQHERFYLIIFSGIVG